MQAIDNVSLLKDKNIPKILTEISEMTLEKVTQDSFTSTVEANVHNATEIMSQKILAIGLQKSSEDIFKKMTSRSVEEMAKIANVQMAQSTSANVMKQYVQKLAPHAIRKIAEKDIDEDQILKDLDEKIEINKLEKKVSMSDCFNRQVKGFLSLMIRKISETELTDIIEQKANEAIRKMDDAVFVYRAESIVYKMFKYYPEQKMVYTKKSLKDVLLKATEAMARDIAEPRKKMLNEVIKDSINEITKETISKKTQSNINKMVKKSMKETIETFICLIFQNTMNKLTEATVNKIAQKTDSSQIDKSLTENELLIKISPPEHVKRMESFIASFNESYTVSIDELEEEKENVLNNTIRQAEKLIFLTRKVAEEMFDTHLNEIASKELSVVAEDIVRNLIESCIYDVTEEIISVLIKQVLSKNDEYIINKKIEEAIRKITEESCKKNSKKKQNACYCGKKSNQNNIKQISEAMIKQITANVNQELLASKYIKEKIEEMYMNFLEHSIAKSLECDLFDITKKAFNKISSDDIEKMEKDLCSKIVNCGINKCVRENYFNKIARLTVKKISKLNVDKYKSTRVGITLRKLLGKTPFYTYKEEDLSEITKKIEIELDILIRVALYRKISDRFKFNERILRYIHLKVWQLIRQRIEKIYEATEKLVRDIVKVNINKILEGAISNTIEECIRKMPETAINKMAENSIQKIIKGDFMSKAAKNAVFNTFNSEGNDPEKVLNTEQIDKLADDAYSKSITEISVRLDKYLAL